MGTQTAHINATHEVITADKHGAWYPIAVTANSKQICSSVGEDITLPIKAADAQTALTSAWV